MKKFFIFFTLLIAIIAGGLFVVVQNLDTKIAQIIEQEGSAALGTNVSVNNVKTDLKEGIATINGLNIANPPGYQNTYAVSLNSFTAKVDYENQVIDEILINKPVINAELIGEKSNFEDLVNNIPESGDTTETSSSTADEQRITIRRFKMSEATITVNATDYAPAKKYGLDNDLDLKDKSFVMQDLVINNLSGTATQIGDQLSTKLTDHVSNQVKRFVRNEVKAELRKKASNKVEKFIDDKLGDKIDSKLKDRLKGLF